MSLLDDAMEAFVILDKVRVDDGYGGYTTQWIESAEILGAMVFDNSLESRKAQAQNVMSVYTFTTRKNVSLEYHDVVKRVRDNKVFRITSDGDDKFTPESASLNMKQVSAEEWKLPNE